MGGAASFFRKRKVHDEKITLVNFKGNKVTPVVPSVPSVPNLEKTKEVKVEAFEDGNITEKSGLVVREPKKKKENLINAAKSGDLDSVKKMLAEREVDKIDKVDDDDEEYWRADVNARGMWSNTPLILACQYGHAEIASLLLKAGADFKLENEKGARPLLYACIEGLADVVTELLRQGDVVDPDPVHIYNPKTDCSQRLTPLLAASINGFDVIVERLLNAGADVNRATIFKIKRGDEFDAAFSEHNGITALVGAAKQNHIETVKLLISRGANQMNEGDAGTDAFFEACKDGRAEMAIMLLNLGRDKSAQHQMVTRQNAKKATPLHLACQKRCLDLVPPLLAAGADPNCLDDREATPLLYAVQMGLEGAVLPLLERGADPAHSDKHGRTPLKLAQKSRNGKGSILKILETWMSEQEELRNQNTPSKHVVDTMKQQLAEEDAILKDVEGMHKETGKQSPNLARDKNALFLDNESTTESNEHGMGHSSEMYTAFLNKLNLENRNLDDETEIEGSIADNLKELSRSGICEPEENHQTAPEVIVVPSPRDEDPFRILSLVDPGATKVYERVSVSVPIDESEKGGKSPRILEAQKALLRKESSLATSNTSENNNNNSAQLEHQTFEPVI